MKNNNSQKKRDIFMLQVRLYRLAQLKWNLSPDECNEIFNRFDVYEYINDCYEEFHVQGDEANINDIEDYLKNRGYAFDNT